jgi:diacylglycerol kinase (ATP)
MNKTNEIKSLSPGSRLKSFSHAFRGLWTLFRDEPNARIHLVAAMVAVGLGLYLGITRMEWVAILGVIALVFSAELINTAIEQLADVVSPEFHPKIKKAKDMAAAAVLVLAALSIGVACFVFLPHFR